MTVELAFFEKLRDVLEVFEWTPEVVARTYEFTITDPATMQNYGFYGRVAGRLYSNYPLLVDCDFECLALED